MEVNLHINVISYPGIFLQHLPWQIQECFVVFLSDKGPPLETLDFAFYIGSTPTFLYFDLYLNTAYAAHYVYFTIWVQECPGACHRTPTKNPRVQYFPSCTVQDLSCK